VNLSKGAYLTVTKTSSILNSVIKITLN